MRHNDNLGLVIVNSIMEFAMPIFQKATTAVRNNNSYNPPRNLYTAASNGDINGIQNFISTQSNYDKPTYYGITPLTIAIINGHFAAFHKLVYLGADVNKKCDEGKTPMHYGAISGVLNVIRVLFEMGADVNAVDNFGKTPLYYAVERNNIHAVRYLVSIGANPNIRPYIGERPIILAMQNNNWGIYNILQPLDHINISKESSSRINTDQSGINLTGNDPQFNLTADIIFSTYRENPKVMAPSPDLKKNYHYIVVDCQNDKLNYDEEPKFNPPKKPQPENAASIAKSQMEEACQEILPSQIKQSQDGINVVESELKKFSFTDKSYETMVQIKSEVKKHDVLLGKISHLQNLEHRVIDVEVSQERSGVILEKITSAVNGVDEIVALPSKVENLESKFEKYTTDSEKRMEVFMNDVTEKFAEFIRREKCFNDSIQQQINGQKNENINPKYKITKEDLDEIKYIEQNYELCQYYQRMRKCFNEAFLFASLVSQGGVLIEEKNKVVKYFEKFGECLGDIPFASLIFNQLKSAASEVSAAKERGKQANLSDIVFNASSIDTDILVEKIARRFVITRELSDKPENQIIINKDNIILLHESRVDKIKKKLELQARKFLKKIDKDIERGFLGQELSATHQLAIADFARAIEFIFKQQITDEIKLIADNDNEKFKKISELIVSKTLDIEIIYYHKENFNLKKLFDNAANVVNKVVIDISDPNMAKQAVSRVNKVVIDISDSIQQKTGITLPEIPVNSALNIDSAPSEISEIMNKFLIQSQYFQMHLQIQQRQFQDQLRMQQQQIEIQQQQIEIQQQQIIEQQKQLAEARNKIDEIKHAHSRLEEIDDFNRNKIAKHEDQISNLAINLDETNNMVSLLYHRIGDSQKQAEEITKDINILKSESTELNKKIISEASLNEENKEKIIQIFKKHDRLKNLEDLAKILPNLSLEIPSQSGIKIIKLSDYFNDKTAISQQQRDKEIAESFNQIILSLEEHGILVAAKSSARSSRRGTPQPFESFSEVIFQDPDRSLSHSDNIFESSARINLPPDYLLFRPTYSASIPEESEMPKSVIIKKSKKTCCFVKQTYSTKKSCVIS